MTRMRGGALLALVILLLFTTAATLVTGHLVTLAKRQSEKTTRAALTDAREALIGYALSYPEQHPGQAIGYLPCPDSANTGSAPGVACHARDHGALGRFPYRTLGLPVLRDGDDQCLWYAVAGSFKHNPKPLTLNWDSPGQFRVVDSNGQPLSGETHDAIAVIIAPGAARPGQHRTASLERCPGSANLADDLPGFLDHSYPLDISGKIDFIHGNALSPTNDLAIWITVDELFDMLRRRPDFSAMLDDVLEAAATALQPRLAELPSNTGFFATQSEFTTGNRAHGRLPPSGTLGVDERATLYDNWRDQLRFVACLDGSACLTVRLAESTRTGSIVETATCRALILFGGERVRGTQRRSTDAERADPAQYLEGVNLQSFTTGAGDYTGYLHYVAAAPSASEELIRCLP